MQPGLDLSSTNDILAAIATSLEHKTFWDSQILGTFLGAALGLIPFFYLLLTDRPKIKVKLKQSLISIGGKVLPAASVEINNSGRRPITVTSVFFKFADGKNLFFVDESLFVGGSGLPKRLDERSSHSVVIMAAEFAATLHKEQRYPIAACFSDALGNTYKRKTRQKYWDSLFSLKGSE